MKKVFLIVIALMLVFSFAYAETFRQGGERITFNQTASTTQTAAYTITASDSLVNITTSSADIVVTLPARSSVGPGTRTYKILKTDATSWVVTVTPATGDTIGGESTRVLVAANDYMVISSASGSKTDWKVDFESSYVAEDYEAGTITLNAQTGGLRSVETITASNTLTRAECGKTVFLNHGSTGIVNTLPLPTKGCYFKFVVMLAFTDDHTIVTSGGADIMIGGVNELEVDTNDDGPSDANADVINFVDTAETVGDYIEMISDGVSWYFNGQSVLDGAFTTGTT